MDIRDDLRGPAGSLEGGVIGTLVDVSGASCGTHHCECPVVTQQIVTNFLSAGLVGPVRTAATPIRLGRSVSLIEVRVFDTGRDDKLTAMALVTVVPLGDRA